MTMTQLIEPIERAIQPAKHARMVYRAFDHKLRQQMMRLIDKRSMTVTEIYVMMRLEQSVVSQHLAILRKAGLVKANRVGKYIHYSVCLGMINELTVHSESLMNAVKTYRK
jgi:DNA-binding transcriptional ArsR family regulator